jgi:hypothetical protein
MIAIDDLQGLWRRSLIIWPDGQRDDTTSVSWLQGPNLYADLRSPTLRPTFHGVAGRNDLTPEQVKWLASQEGFAGRLTFDGQFFEWHRLIDFQPMAAIADSGRLWFGDGCMIEEGRVTPYIEHWHRSEQEPRTPNGAIHFTDIASGVEGFLVRAGAVFMYARDRDTSLNGAGSLSEQIMSAAPGEAQAMVDCEISLGRIGPSGWIIETSSLPYREGASLWPVLSADPKQFNTADVTVDGAPMMRSWTIAEIEGDLALAEVMAPTF